MLEMMTRKGKARLTRSQISTGLILSVLGRVEETERYTEVSTIMQVMLTVINRSVLPSTFR